MYFQYNIKWIYSHQTLFSCKTNNSFEHILSQLLVNNILNSYIRPDTIRSTVRHHLMSHRTNLHTHSNITRPAHKVLHIYSIQILTKVDYILASICTNLHTSCIVHPHLKTQNIFLQIKLPFITLIKSLHTYISVVNINFVWHNLNTIYTSSLHPKTKRTQYMHVGVKPSFDLIIYHIYNHPADTVYKYFKFKQQCQTFHQSPSL